jgi:hypothetical protein
VKTVFWEALFAPGEVLPDESRQPVRALVVMAGVVVAARGAAVSEQRLGGLERPAKVTMAVLGEVAEPARPAGEAALAGLELAALPEAMAALGGNGLEHTMRAEAAVLQRLMTGLLVLPDLVAATLLTLAAEAMWEAEEELVL